MTNQTETPQTGRQFTDDVTTSDGAVRQLEKADLIAAKERENGGNEDRPDGPGPDLNVARPDTDWGEVIAIGKERGGAPEDAVPDTQGIDASPNTDSP